jgi:hypothetical protein
MEAAMVNNLPLLTVISPSSSTPGKTAGIAFVCWAKVSVEGWIPLATALEYLPQDTATPPETVEPVDEEFHQCEATTQKGTQCSRRAMKGSRYCWQHQNYEKGKK